MMMRSWRKQRKAYHPSRKWYNVVSNYVLDFVLVKYSELVFAQTLLLNARLLHYQIFSVSSAPAAAPSSLLSIAAPGPATGMKTGFCETSHVLDWAAMNCSPKRNHEFNCSPLFCLCSRHVLAVFWPCSGHVPPMLRLHAGVPINRFHELISPTLRVNAEFLSQACCVKLENETASPAETDNS